jgi:glycosyltransferase involved in cell wall biosynthesis
VFSITFKVFPGGIGLADIDLSAVIITKNEEDSIGACIRAVMIAINNAIKHKVIKTAEVILVDSASGDGTVAIAEKFPITILRMPSDWKVSAGAGRFFGLKHARGRFVCNVDGDTKPAKDWLVKAFPELLKSKRIAGVCGIYMEEKMGDTVTEKLIREAELTHTTGEIDTISVGLFKRKAIMDIGSYNPHLTAAEDKEFTKRGLLKGYRFLRLNEVEGEHYLTGSDERYTFIDYMKRFIWYGKGEGQSARYHLKFGEKKLFLMFGRYYFNYSFIRAYIVFLFYTILIGFNMLAFFITGTVPYFLPIIITFDLIMILLWLLAKTNETAYLMVMLGAKLQPEYKKSENYKVLLFNLSIIPYVLSRHFGFIQGFIPGPSRIESYPLNIELVKNGEIIK